MAETLHDAAQVYLEHLRKQGPDFAADLYTFFQVRFGRLKIAFDDGQQRQGCRQQAGFVLPVADLLIAPISETADLWRS